MDLAVADRAERLAGQRSLVAMMMGVALIVTQGQRMVHGHAGLVSWALTGLITALFLVWASGAFRSGALQRILNDESSQLSRRRAIAIGFCNMIATALVCYALTFVKDYGARDAIQIIMTVGMSSALISFSGFERFSRDR
jgi:hypothetical protein